MYADLGELVNKKKPGRENDRELIHFAAIGMGISDVALASLIQRRHSNVKSEPVFAVAISGGSDARSMMKRGAIGIMRPSTRDWRLR